MPAVMEIKNNARSLRIFGTNSHPLAADTLVLLENDPNQALAIRRLATRCRLNLYSALDISTCLSMAEGGARFFILDINLGKQANLVTAGLSALEALKRKYGNQVFVAILTAWRARHERRAQQLRADMIIEKSGKPEVDFQKIFDGWRQWEKTEKDQPSIEGEPLPHRLQLAFGLGSSESGHEDVVAPEALLPSNKLALEILRAGPRQLASLIEERQQIARIEDQPLPTYSDLEEEIGTRMREEIRSGLGVLLSDQDSDAVVLVREGAPTHHFTRFLFSVLPLSYPVDHLLELLAIEFKDAARIRYSGEWGELRLENEMVMLTNMLAAEPQGNLDV